MWVCSAGKASRLCNIRFSIAFTGASIATKRQTTPRSSCRTGRSWAETRHRPFEPLCIEPTPPAARTERQQSEGRAEDSWCATPVRACLISSWLAFLSRVLRLDWFNFFFAIVKNRIGAFADSELKTSYLPHNNVIFAQAKPHGYGATVM